MFLPNWLPTLLLAAATVGAVALWSARAFFDGCVGVVADAAAAAAVDAGVLLALLVAAATRLAAPALAVWPAIALPEAAAVACCSRAMAADGRAVLTSLNSLLTASLSSLMRALMAICASMSCSTLEDSDDCTLEACRLASCSWRRRRRRCFGLKWPGATALTSERVAAAGAAASVGAPAAAAGETASAPTGLTTSASASIASAAAATD